MESTAFIKGLETVTSRWCKQRKREERESSARANRWYAMTRSCRTSIKEAAEEVMEAAYLKASADDTLPAHARQIMYAARGEILRLTGRHHLNDAYFTQTILPDYINEHPEAQSWTIVYDARGHFAEPHADSDVPLGTLDVRDYLEKIESHQVEPPTIRVDTALRYPTRGAAHRFGAVLFCEKEGFWPLFKAVGLATRYDLAVMSTKGMSNIASRCLIDSLCGESGIPLLVLHDFDADGFKILGTLAKDTDRYEYEHSVNVIDLGLRLADVKRCKLEAEPVHHKRGTGAHYLSCYGATEAEIAFLKTKRVELNAFASGDLLAWLEAKLKKHGVKKVVPDRKTQAAAYRRAVEVQRLKRIVQDAIEKAQGGANDVEVPGDLDREVRSRLKKDRSITWDRAVAEYAWERAFVQNDGG